MKRSKITVLELVGSFHRGGAEVFVLNLAKHIDKSKFNIIVCSVVRDDMSFIDVSEFKNVKLISLSRSAHSGRLKGILELCRIVKKKKVDIIHTHCQSPDFYGRIVGLIMRIPVITTIHSTKGYSKFRENTFGLLTKKYIAISDKCYKYMIEEVMIPCTKIIRINNGVDTNLFKRKILNSERYLSNFGIIKTEDKPSFIITTVANLSTPKGYDYLIESAFEVIHRLKSEFNVYFLFVGDDTSDYSKLIKEKVNSLKISDQIIFTGVRKDIPEIFSISDLYISSSRYEGLSISIIEAMAAGLPIIATDVGSIREMIENEVSGIIIPPEDPKAIAEKVIELVQNPSKRRSLGENARKESLKFDIRNVATQHEELYGNIINRK